MLQKQAIFKHTYSIYFLKNPAKALAGVAQWIEFRPTNQRAAGLVPSQGTCLGCRSGPWLRVCERQPYTDVSLPLFLPLIPSLSK